MRQASSIGRLGLLAGGLGIGAALACTPGIASADPSTDPFSWIDQLLAGLSVPAQTTSALDYQVSINGMDLFSTVDNTATATSGTGDIAIAIGSGANAIAGGASLGGILPLGGGIGDFAFADGTDSDAEAAVLGGANLDFVVAAGAGSQAQAGLGANVDSVIADGTGSHAQVAIGASDNSAFAEGTGSSAEVGLGNYDLATALGTASSATAGGGNYDSATAVSGGVASASELQSSAYADGANSDAVANGIGDIATVFNTGSALDQATASGGDNVIAEIFGTGSTAVAGGGGDWDLAAAFGDLLHASATGANFLLDILPSL
jgi:hypothetical protein